MNKIVISCLNDYLNYKKSNNNIYRGVKDYKFIMAPSLFRNFIIDDNNIDEIDIQQDCTGTKYNLEKLSKCIDLESEYLNKIRCYETDFKCGYNLISFCQHYGLNTRFLDFTTNIDVALYFACFDWDSDEISYENDGKIISVDREKIKYCFNDENSLVELEILFDLICDPESCSEEIENYKVAKSKDYVLYEPFIEDKRIMNQGGVLLCFPDFTYQFITLTLSEKFIEQEIIIKKECKEELSKYLKDIGIDSKFIKVKDDLYMKKSLLDIIDDYNKKFIKIKNAKGYKFE